MPDFAVPRSNENGSDHDSGTRVTLLGRLRRDPTNQAIWAEFVEHYGTKIFTWCRKWNLQEADAQDVTQNVLLKLADKMRTFHYDPSRSFRAWLKTLTHHAWSDFLESRQRPGRGSGDSQVADMLHSVEPATIWCSTWKRNSTANCWRKRWPSASCASPRRPGRRFA